MRIAMPVADGKLAIHFGHAPSFAILDIDAASKKIVKREDIPAPPHAPGLLPPWMAERGVTLVIAGGMGARAVNLFSQHQIQVVLGAPSDSPENVASSYLSGQLQTGSNPCDH